MRLFGNEQLPIAIQAVGYGHVHDVDFVLFKVRRIYLESTVLHRMTMNILKAIISNIDEDGRQMYD